MAFEPVAWPLPRVGSHQQQSAGGECRRPLIERRGHGGAAEPRYRVQLYFVLAGSVTVEAEGASHAMGVDDSITIPGRTPYALAACSADLWLLEVTLPATFETTTLRK